MKGKVGTGFLMAALLLCAGIAVAQETEIEIRNGVVLAVNGNEVMFRGPEGVRTVTVPDDFRFDMGGKQLSVHQLEPGMRLTAVIKTTTRPVSMTVTEVKRGQIIHTQGGAVVVRREDGEVVKFTSKSLKKTGAVITKDGKPIDLTTLRQGDMIEATIISEGPPTMVTEEEMKVYAASAPPPPKPRPAPRPAPAPAPAPKAMPKTASDLPLIGLSGLILLVIGAGLTVLRRLS
jgi:hypothetical protein